MRPLVYLDLDRTLFRTADTGQLWQQISQLYPSVDAVREYSRRTEFHVTIGDLYYCDMAAHLISIGLDPGDVYGKLQSSDVADGRLEYEGVGELVSSLLERADVKVLTFGTDDYQRLKVSLCPSLRSLEVITTLRPKAEYLRTENTGCWVVDDKAIGHELPPYARFVQVSLEGLPFPENATWPCFTSLKDVKDYLDEALH